MRCDWSLIRPCARRRSGSSQSALVQLLDEGDAEAHAFQRQQMAALREELAPPGSPIGERLLAEAIAKARFEYLMWSARSDYLLLHPPPKPPHYHVLDSRADREVKDKAHIEFRAQRVYEERARAA